MDGRKIFIFLSIVLTIASIMIFVPWDQVKVSITPLPDTIEEQLDDAIDQGIDGIIIYVNQNGETRKFSAGWFDKEAKIEADADDLFKIASISKLYIAVATSKLVSEGELSLEDTLETLLPDLTSRIDNSELITLRMLLQHRSGIPNFVDFDSFSWMKPKETNIEVLELVYDLPADFKPDQDYRYSNTNYVLIGEILDRVLGYSHHQYIKDEILEPLGLKHTYNLLNDVDLNDLMSGYSLDSDYDFKNLDYVHPGGSMISTAEEVGLFLRALIDGLLLNTREEEIYSSVYVYEHTGLLPGYQSIAKYYEDIDAVVIQFVSTSGGDSWAKSEAIYNRIIKILRKEN